MSQPQWVTPAGSLGTIPEGIFYQTIIKADAGIETVYYRVIAGQLPDGIQLNTNGILEGLPSTVVTIQGVPTQVNQDVTSKFAIRAYTTKIVNGVTVIDRINDRTFTLTIAGQNIPEFITPAGNVGTFYDGTAISIQIEYTDVDPGDNVRLQVQAGTLPPGVTITNTGLITGVIQPLTGPPDTATAGYDNTNFDQYPFDFSTRSSSTNYQFILEVTDGKSTNIRSFEIFVYSKDSMSADTTDFTADNTFITADVVPTRTPVLLTQPGSLGRVRSDNFYALRFEAVDFDGDPVEYLINGSLPGLTLNSLTGWLYGYIPNLGATDNTYNFTITVRKLNNPTIASAPAAFSITFIGNIETAVTWITGPDLGTINNGAVSTLYVEAISASGRTLSYQLESGAANKLPQGLTLLSSGELAGTVSFNTFAIDGGATTFDRNIRTRSVRNETTFDMVCTFTVNAYAPGSDADIISVFQTFSVRVIRAFNEPYQGLYIKCMPPMNDREIITQLVQNQDIIPAELVYRKGDPNFGVASSVIYNHVFGLTAASLETYVAALDINHYWKYLTLGPVEYAQATNEAGEVIYEAVYSRVIDNLVNNQGQSVSKSVELPYPIGGVDSTLISTVYPNSLINMRDQVIDVVGQISPMLPGWMVSKQANGTVLGFVPAWVIAYVKPGQGARVVYNIQQQFGDQLNLIDFKADRYEIDRRVTFAWDPYDDSTEAGQWQPGPPVATTFDLVTYPTLGTYFDGGGTTFITPANTTTTTDAFDKYILYPRTNILG